MACPEGRNLCCGGKSSQNHFHPGQPYSIVLTQAMEGWPNSPGLDKVHPYFLSVSPIGRPAGGENDEDAKMDAR